MTVAHDEVEPKNGAATKIAGERLILDPARASPRFLERISHDFARSHLLLSQGVNEHGSFESLAVADSTSPFAIHNTSVVLGRAVEPVVVAQGALAEAIDAAYASCDHERDAENDALTLDVDEINVEQLLAETDRDLLSAEGKGPIVKLVDAILFGAATRGASDVHIEPMEHHTLVRYRLDGVLHTARELPRHLTPAIVSRIKVMGRMDIAERRIPQDGRATVTIGRSASGAGGGGGPLPIDLRISTLPTAYGERAVIRLLDKSRSAGMLSFSSLGMDEVLARQYLERAGRSSGIVLVTGPTGSGKTTTLYATLRWNAESGSGERNIMTIEDPIEYELSSVGVTISQSQINTRKGVTFVTGLRHILRQDPDVIMVGEIRDSETARTAIQASLTGHLVYSTLHTNDAASAATRLLDLGVEPYLLSATLSTVLAQRLARRIHADCGGAGCKECASSGFRGRVGLFELLLVDSRIKELISTGASVAAIRQAAIEAGMRTLAQQGRASVEGSVTTQVEVDRVVQGANE